MPATYEPIATYTLSSAQSSITFSTILSTWTDLRVIMTMDGTIDASSVYIRLNGDTSTNYSRTLLGGNGSTVFSTQTTNGTWIGIGGVDTSGWFSTIDFFSYAGSTNKTFLITSSLDKNGSGSVSRWVALWRNTSAITSILLDASIGGGQLPTGTTATLYGIKSA